MSDNGTESPVDLSEGYREFDGWLGHLIKAIFIALPVMGCFFIMDVPFYLEWNILREQYYGLILAMILPLTFILIPMGAHPVPAGSPARA